MTNPIFPKFDFNKWLVEYVIHNHHHMNGWDLFDREEMEEQLKEQQEKYHAQIHETNCDDEVCASCLYADYLKEFSEFMVIVCNHDVKFGAVMEHFMKQRLPQWRYEDIIQKYTHELLKKLEIPYDGTSKIDI